MLTELASAPTTARSNLESPLKSATASETAPPGVIVRTGALRPNDATACTVTGTIAEVLGA